MRNPSEDWFEESFSLWAGCESISPGCELCQVNAFTAFGPTRDAKLAKYHKGAPVSPTALKLGAIKSLERKSRITRTRSLVVVNRFSDFFDARNVEIPWSKDNPIVSPGAVSHSMDAARKRALRFMFDNPSLAFVIETKRPHLVTGVLKRIAKGSSDPTSRSIRQWLSGDCPPNIWIGVSVETIGYAWRVDELRRIPVGTRFVNFSPLISSPRGIDLDGIDWVLCGGEYAGFQGEGRPSSTTWFDDVIVAAREKSIPLWIWRLGSKVYAPIGDLRFKHTPAKHDPATPDGYRRLSYFDNESKDMTAWPESFRIRQYPRARKFET